MNYSVVVPMYNEIGNVAMLHQELEEVLGSLGRYEIIYVDDGSTDGTLEELKKMPSAKIICLNRNYGQSIALDAGFKEAQGEWIISMDGDLQNDPADIIPMLDKMRADNLDVITGWRKNRKDAVGIQMLTKVGHVLRKLLINDNVHDSGCTLRVYRKEAVKSLDLWGEMHRYILALLRWKGFTIGEIEVNHRARRYGKTKYGYTKAVKGFIDLMYVWFIHKFAHKPLHIFGFIGLLCFALGIWSEMWTFYQKVIEGLSLNRNGWFFLGFFFLLMGVIFFTFGITLDLLIRTQLNTSPYEKRYHIKQILQT